MTNLLREEDIQKIIEEINKVEIPTKNNRMSASKMTDKNGNEKFVLSLWGIGSLILTPDAEGIYQIEKIESDAGKLQKDTETFIYMLFNTLVKEYTGKDWPDNS